MKTVVSILTKTIVRSFYKEYALVFLIGLYICFGFLKSDDHIFLAKYIVSSEFLIGIYFAFWTLYNVFIISFFNKFLNEKSNFFLLDLNLLNRPVLAFSLLILHLNLFAPVIVYAIFVIGISVSMGFIIQAVYIICFLFISSVYPLFIYFNTLSQPDISLSKAPLFKIKFNFKKPSFSFFFFHLFESEWLKLLITKGLSAVLLLALSQILQTDNDDIRPLLIVVLMGFLPNFSLASSYHSFENQSMFYFKNLPVSLVKKWIMAIGTFAIILIPEMFLLYRYAWTNLSWYAPALSYILGLSLISIYYSGLFLKIASGERFSNLIFLAGVVCFVAILFKMNVLLLAIIIFSGSYFAYSKLYYQYEMVLKSEE